MISFRGNSQRRNAYLFRCTTLETRIIWKDFKNKNQCPHNFWYWKALRLLQSFIVHEPHIERSQRNCMLCFSSSPAICKKQTTYFIKTKTEWREKTDLLILNRCFFFPLFNNCMFATNAWLICRLNLLYFCNYYCFS